MSVAPRLLFHSPSRRGLGHAVRCANLARAVRDVAPDAAVLLHLSSPAAGMACGDDVPWVADADTSSTRWAGVVAAFRPTLTVFDTLLPQSEGLDAAPAAFVWRRTGDLRHATLTTDPRLAKMRVIVVPHGRDEFTQPIPARLAARTVFTGPIVRGADADGVARVRAKYRLQPDDFLLTSTLGGGGFDESARWLVDVVLRAHDRLCACLPRLRHVLVRGPLHAGGPVESRDRLMVVDSDPDLVALFAASALVVAEAGYNTVNELHHAGVPALLIPGERTVDDQHERARRMADRGLVRMTDRRSADDAVAAIVDLALDGKQRAHLSRMATAAPPAAGNRQAAVALLAAAR